jgi:choline-sulfatase
MTALIGKMHFLDARTHGFDYKLDFKDWFEYLGPKTRSYAEETYYPDSGEGLPDDDDLWRESGDPWRGNLERDGRQGASFPGHISSLPEEDHFESFVARESIRFLNRFGTKQPFLLISSFLKPHAPWAPAERFAKMFHPQDMTLPDTWGKVDLTTVPKFIRESIQYHWVTPELRDPEQAKVRIAMYYACLAQMDDNLGKILQTLKQLDLEKDTVVLYTSDHGDMLGEHGLWQKFVFYEGSAGVPLIYRVPGITPPNTRSKTPVSLVQTVATLAELCDVPVPSGLDGMSFAASLLEPQKTLDTRVFVEHALDSKTAGFMIRRGSYKYSYYPNDMPELYNLELDPQEMTNLALLPAYRDKSEEMRQELFAWHVPEETRQDEDAGSGSF